MTGVQIFIPPFLQSYTEDSSRATISGETIMECLTALTERFPQLRSQLFEANGGLRSGLNVFLNDFRVHPHEFFREVKEGDKLYIAHVISGG